MDLTTLERLPLWIGGRAVPARTRRYGEVTNPATGEVVRHVPFSNADDVADAVAAASAAFAAWRAAPPLRRARPDAFSGVARSAQEGPCEDRHGRARQDSGRCRGLDHARDRGGRIRDR